MKKIIHIDMDAFYASVEQRDNPEFKGKPLIVGGDPERRGVVSACSYEARKYGIHSAMACKTAVKLCPHAVFLPPRFSAYKEVSSRIREIFFRYTDLVEPLSLDEAFLDVTENREAIESATIIARNIKEEILNTTGLTASAGVSYNKFLAKVASDYQKPDGITVVTPARAQEFIDALPIRKFFGIGKATEKRFIDLGVKTGYDLRMMDKNTIVRLFGKMGSYFYHIARGIDDREVNPHRIRKSISCETTLAEDTIDSEVINSVLEKLSVRLEDMIKRYKKNGKTVTLKVKYHDFTAVTRSVTIDSQLDDKKAIESCIHQLLHKTEVYKKKVRLLGIGVSNFNDEGAQKKEEGQLSFQF